MNKILLLISLHLLCICCGRNIKVSDININTFKADDYALDVACSDVLVESLELDGQYLSNDYFLKSYNDYIFILDSKSHTIHILDKDFNYISLFDKHGRGQGEYISIGSFAYDSYNRELVIFDRTSKNFIGYDITELKHTRSIKYDSYIMAMEYLSSGVLFLTVEADGDDNGSLNIVKIEGDSIFTIYSQKENFMVVELSPDMTITHNENGSILYSKPSFINTLYSVDQNGFDSLLTFNFGESNVPLKFWNSSSDDDMNLMEVMGSQSFAIMPQYCMIGSQDKFSCWFLHQESDSRDYPSTFAYSQRSKDEIKVIKNLTIDGIEDISLKPIGIVDGYYVSIIESDEISNNKSVESDSKITEKIGQAATSGDYVIIKYKFY